MLEKQLSCAEILRRVAGVDFPLTFRALDDAREDLDLCERGLERVVRTNRRGSQWFGTGLRACLVSTFGLLGCSSESDSKLSDQRPVQRYSLTT